MDYEQLCGIIENKLIPIFKDSTAISLFVWERSKFEGWLKVELCGVLFDAGQKVKPEDQTIDITCEGCAIELKTITHRFEVPELPDKKTKRMYKTIDSLLDEINDLKFCKYENKIVLFVLFPYVNNEYLLSHINKINDKLIDRKSYKVCLNNGSEIMLYIGRVNCMI